MSDDAFGTLMASADPPMVVVTVRADDHQAGCLVGFHGQSSITPEHYGVWLSKANHTYRLALRTTRLAVHFLTVDDLALAERFGTLCSAETDKFAGLDVEVGPDGVPQLVDCPNRITLERIALLDSGGDHVCLTTQVTSARTGGPFEPLRLSQVDQLQPGHESEERAIRP